MIRSYRTNARAARAGTSMVEVLLGVTLLALMLGSIGVVSLSSKSAFSRGTSRCSVELRSGIVESDILDELEMAIGDSFTPALAPGVPVATLQYERAMGWDGNDVVRSNDRVLRWELEPGEANNGGDDDGDGLVDEGLLVLVDDFGLPSQTRRILARGVAEYLDGEMPNGVDDNSNGLVDEPGFLVVPRGGTLDVNLTLSAAAADGSEIVERTVRTSVLLRN